jgi:AcrR family transcriptional regulator
MPRALNETERAHITELLHERGRERFARQGLEKTTISELVEDAGIGKGSFYLFFERKEDLFLSIQAREEARFRAALGKELAGKPPREAITTLLSAPSRRLREHPFLRLLVDPRTLAELMLRVGRERLETEQSADREFFKGLTRTWLKQGKLRRNIDAEEVFATLTGMFLVELGRNVAGDDATNRARDALMLAVVERWCP